MQIHKRSAVIAAGVVITLLPVAALAAAQSGRPDFCETKNQPADKVAVCSVYDLATSTKTVLDLVTNRVTQLEGEVSTLKQANQQQAIQIANLSGRVGALEATPTPTPTPTPSTIPLPIVSAGSGGACDNGHGNGGYPMVWCNAPMDSYSTPWGYSRENVSWTGWRRSQLGRGAGAWGNANTWDDNARAAGYRVDNTPEVGAIAQTDAGFYGHTAVVEAINSGGIIVSEMSYDGDGHFRVAQYSASYFKYIH